MEHTLFNLLSPEQQQKALLHQGIPLSERIDGDYLIILYSLCGFYVESYFNFECFELERYVTFDSLELLEPYLEQICIDELRLLT